MAFSSFHFINLTCEVTGLFAEKGFVWNNSIISRNMKCYEKLKPPKRKIELLNNFNINLNYRLSVYMYCRHILYAVHFDI